MADADVHFEVYKAAANKYCLQLQTAASKDEAFNFAISAADNLMKALKLAPDANEKKDLRTQCGIIMDIADRIKKDSDWKLAVRPLGIEAETEQIDDRAAKDEHTTSSAPNLSDAASHSHSNLTQIDHISTTQLADGASAAKASVKPTVEQQTNAGPSRNTSLVASPSGPVLPSSQQGLLLRNEIRAAPSLASYSHIRRLAEPLSTRKRSKKEEIILLKASMVNGFKCPPWDKFPSPAEFVRLQGEDLFTDTHDLSLSSYQQQFFKGWIRASLAVPPVFMSNEGTSNAGPLMSSPDTIDLVQDAATDCSVVTSLCAGIARSERGHDQMLTNKLYPFDKQLGKPIPSTNGKYIVRLNFNGCWRKVVIDDRLPVSSTHRLLHVVDRRNPALLWPALLEKAYLKIRGGYDFPGSNSCSDLWTLTGWIPEQVFLQEIDTVPDKLWVRVYKAFLYGDVLITAGTGRMSSRQERELGLEGQHSYVVLDMKEVGEDRLLLVKNPWVEGKGWKGPRPSAIPELDPPTPSQGNPRSLETYHRDSVPTQEKPHPTTFWIGLEQVIQHFESLYLNWNPGLFGHRQDIHFEWNVDIQQSPGGCIVKHPQFAFWSKENEAVWFLLSRHFRDMSPSTKDESDAFNDGSIRHNSLVDCSGEHPKGFMSMYIGNGHGERLYIKEGYSDSSDYVTTPQCLLRWDAKANTTHTIVVDQDELPPSVYTFTLSAFSNSPISLEPATQKYPLQQIREGAWTRQSAGGSTSSSRYFENPQYLLEVKERGSLAVLLTGNHEHPLHVKVALGYGKRIYRLQSRDVLVDSGNHRSGSCFAEISDVQPGFYTIICSLFEAGQTGDYTLRVDSTSTIRLEQITRDGAGLLSTKLTPACFGAQVHKIAAALVPRRLASYTIIARFLKATSPRGMGVDLGKLARSPLRLSVELGRGPERKFVIASERGEYADSATVRSESVTIDAALANQGELWLVLDRLSGPGGPVEEWYEVEIYTDMPQAFSIGVWRDWDD